MSIGSTIRRLLGRVDADRLDAVIGGFVARRCAATAPAGRRRVLAVDGKTLRGSRHTGSDGAEVAGRHLLAVIDQHTRVVLGQVAVDGKTSEVRREAPCRIPDSVGRNLEDSSWVRWLTLSRKVTGTRACHGYRRSCPDVRSGASGNPRDMAKPGLAESQSPAMQLFIHRKWRLKPVPRSVSGYFVTGCNFQSVGRCPVRTFKGMSGTGGFDCSGLTKAAYAAAGIPLPRTAQAQYTAGIRRLRALSGQQGQGAIASRSPDALSAPDIAPPGSKARWR